MHNDISYSCVMLKCHNNALRKLILETYEKYPIESLAPGENEGNFNPHVTILYGIHTNKLDEILHPLQNISFVNYKTTGISLFTNNEKYDVLKIDISSIDLQFLNRKLRHALKHENFYPKYIPHMTIAYIRKNQQNISKKIIDLNYFKNLHDISHSIKISTGDNKAFNFNLQSKRLEQVK